MPTHEFSIDTQPPHNNIILDLIQQDFFSILNRCITDRDQKFQLFNELMKIVLNDPRVFPLCLNWFDDLLTNNPNLTQLSNRIDRLKLEWVNHAKATQTQIEQNERLPHW